MHATISTRIIQNDFNEKRTFLVDGFLKVSFFFKWMPIKYPVINYV